MIDFDPSRVRSATALYIGRVGDVIVATPFLRALRRRFPEARLRLIVGHRSVQVLPLIPFIDSSAVLHRVEHPWSNLRLAWKVLTEPCDLLADLNSSYSRTSTILARAVRAPVKLSFKKGRMDSAFTHQIPAPEEREHMSERYRRLADALGAPYAPELELSVPPEDDRRAEEIVAALPKERGPRLRILVHPGNFDRFSFRWPEEKFIELTNRLLEDEGLSICYMGGPGEEAKVRSIVERLRRPVPVLPPSTLGVLAGVLKRTDLFVCNTTGTTHLAAAVGTRTFTIHAGYTYNVWRPLGPRHGFVLSDAWQTCRDLPVDAVHSALKDFLGPLRASGLS